MGDLLEDIRRSDPVVDKIIDDQFTTDITVVRDATVATPGGKTVIQRKISKITRSK